MTSPMPFLIFMAMASPIALNALLPVLPTLAQHFDVSSSVIQLSVSLYLAALAVGQLLVGVFINMMGQKRTLWLGLASFVIGSLLGLLHFSLEFLLLGRMLQGVGGAIMMSSSRALLISHYGSGVAPQKMGYVVMAIALSQSVAPLLGGYIYAWVNWASIFIVSMIQGGLLFWLGRPHLDTVTSTAKRLTFQATLTQYGLLLKNSHFRVYALSNTYIACCFYIFVGSAPFITSSWQVDPHLFGYWFLSISAGFLVGGYLSTQLNQRMPVNKTIVLGNLVGLTGAVLLLVLQFALEPSFAALFLPMTLVTLGRGISQPSYQSAGLSTLSEQSGTAAGLMGFLQLACGAVVSQLTPWMIGLYTPLFAISIFALCALATWQHAKLGFKLLKTK